jgi:hypothetical protein
VYKFLKKYGLDHIAGPAQAQPPQGLPQGPPAPGTRPEEPTPAPGTPPQDAPALGSPRPPLGLSPASLQPPLPCRPADATPSILLPGPSLLPAQAPAPPFSSGGHSTPAPSC